jgi:hypothetical protein
MVNNNEMICIYLVLIEGPAHGLQTVDVVVGADAIFQAVSKQALASFKANLTFALEVRYDFIAVRGEFFA